MDLTSFSVTIPALIRAAIQARVFAYTPYSGFAVGAALLTSDGKIYTGCNIENAAFSPTNCAERTAFFKAVSEGVREFCAIAIVGGSSDTESIPEYIAPCGVCRQVMAEFCTGDFLIIRAKSETDYRINTLSELLPEMFGAAQLPKPHVGGYSHADV